MHELKNLIWANDKDPMPKVFSNGKKGDNSIWIPPKEVNSESQNQADQKEPAENDY